MTEATLEHGGPLPREEVNASPGWVRPTLLIIFCAGLLIAIGAAFTQVIAARVPEQRATLEKLITDRTGLAVRFDNVHFAWNMEGTSAVFEHVELTDPVRGRVRVVAPELRVEFDTWDFLRHQQFSLGHVTLSSPDIDIIGDAESEPEIAPVRPGGRQPVQTPRADEAAWIRRFTAWAELMPVGRVEVEGARVHLFRRGERAARHHFTLSQAVVSRGSQSFNAFGTLLLSQDIGQSLFVSAKLENMASGDSARASAISGELRLIARRVLLGKLPWLAAAGKPRADASLAARGRGTVDARLTLREGRIHDGSWQISAREMQLPGGDRFDHFTVQGRLSRAPGGFALDFDDLQITRGARLERAPKISARVSFSPGTLQPSQVTARAERVPFMAVELIAALAPGYGAPSFEKTGWSATAGELHDLRFDSRADTLSAHARGAELVRTHDRARLSNLAARIHLEGEHAIVTFDGAAGAQWQMADAEPRSVQLTGELTSRGASELDFTGLRLQSGDASVVVDGSWGPGKNPGRPLTVELAGIDRALAGDAWSLLAFEPPAHWADLQQGSVVTGSLSLVPAANADHPGVDWARSRGSLELAGLASTGADVPRLAAAAGKLEFARGAAQLRLTSGTLEDLQLTDVRVDWPKRGPARLRAQAGGDLASPLLRRALGEQGLERLTGTVSLEAEARGASELRDPASWRVTARIRDASLPLASGLPAVEGLRGTVRLAGGALRGLALEGNWLNGPLQIESRRATADRVTSAKVSGLAESAALLELLGQPDAAGQINGQVAWSGTLQRREQVDGDAGWQLTLASDLGGLESKLPQPFNKPRSRSLPVTAELHFDAQGIDEFEISGGRASVRGRVQQGVTQARFDILGVAGELRAGSQTTDPRLSIDRLDLQRAPAVLAAAGWLSPQDRELELHVTELRHAGRALGALDASLIRQAKGVEFSLESPAASTHRVDASGSCSAEQRCRMEFTVGTRNLPALLGDTKLPAEWPTQSLRASGDLAWQGAGRDLPDTLTGQFELETDGMDSSHHLLASAVLADGQIDLTDVQGLGPAPDEVFRGRGHVSLAARTYDLTVDYQQVSLAASAVPAPARVRLSRAWSSLRSSVSGRALTETAPARRVQWHGSWD